MGFANRAWVAGGLGIAASLLAGCGSSGGLLTPGQAGNLKGQLGQISAELSAGHCRQAKNAIQNFQNSVDNLGGVDGTLVSNLDQGASTIADLAAKSCPAHQPTTASTTTSTPTTTETTTTATTPATTTTTTPTTPTTPTTTAPTTTTLTTIPPMTTTTPTTTTSSGGTGLSGGSGGGAQDAGAGNGGTPPGQQGTTG